MACDTDVCVLCDYSDEHNSKDSRNKTSPNILNVWTSGLIFQF
jgi:hypothetical protein